ncbi:MAG: ATP-binding cassette domain-containing protein [Rhodocyclaceae bacterium]
MLFDLDIDKSVRSGKRTFRLHVRFSSDSQRIVIFGSSGSGKSMTLKAIAGLIKPDSGHIRLDRSALFDSAAGIDLRPQARQVAYLFQDYALFPHLTVRQNIGFGLFGGLRNPPAGQQLEAVDYWLDAFHLDHLAHQYPADISGGQQQRTALARALIARPRALLLDEPFSALDPGLRRKMRLELDELQRRLSVPMILITHDPEDADVFGDQVLCLNDGRIVAPQGTPEAEEAS